MRIYSASQHIGDEDFAWCARKLGHVVDIHSYSGHSHIMGRDKYPMDYDINQLHNSSYCQCWCDEHTHLRDYDAFYTFYLPLQALLFEPYGKKIIMNCPVRYEHPYSNRAREWDIANYRLRTMVESGQLTIVTNSRYDQEYTQHYLGPETPVRYIPSLCSYVGRGQEQHSDGYGWLLSSYSQSSVLSTVDGLTHTSALGKHSWADLSRYVGTVIIPYNCSVMSFYEWYWLGLRVAVPSRSLLLKLYSTKSALEQLYWTSDRNGWDWEAHMDAMDWYNRTEYPDVEEYRSYREAIEIVNSDSENRAARTLINEGREERALRAWQEVLDATGNHTVCR